jgi:hypothetical protein
VEIVDSTIVDSTIVDNSVNPNDKPATPAPTTPSPSPATPTPSHPAGVKPTTTPSPSPATATPTKVSGDILIHGYSIEDFTAGADSVVLQAAFIEALLAQIGIQLSRDQVILEFAPERRVLTSIHSPSTKATYTLKGLSVAEAAAAVAEIAAVVESPVNFTELLRAKINNLGLKPPETLRTEATAAKYVPPANDAPLPELPDTADKTKVRRASNSWLLALLALLPAPAVVYRHWCQRKCNRTADETVPIEIGKWLDSISPGLAGYKNIDGSTNENAFIDKGYETYKLLIDQAHDETNLTFLNDMHLKPGHHNQILRKLKDECNATANDQIQDTAISDQNTAASETESNGMCGKMIIGLVMGSRKAREEGSSELSIQDLEEVLSNS